MAQEKKASSLKLSDPEKVEEWMMKLEHPLKAEIDVVRNISKEQMIKFLKELNGMRQVTIIRKTW
ncbi:MAG TPA: hypothetical protein VF622_09875 [Segetibacter sp.]|jgi:hypothetical protein